MFVVPCCSDARQSAVAAWGWPPPELGPSAALPLLDPSANATASGSGSSAAGGKRPRIAGKQPPAEQTAPPLGLPADWHAPETEVALAAALQLAALPPALDSATSGATRMAPVLMLAVCTAGLRLVRTHMCVYRICCQSCAGRT